MDDKVKTIDTSSLLACLTTVSGKEADEYDRQLAEKEKETEAADLEKRYQKKVPRRYWTESLDTYCAGNIEQQKLLDGMRAFVADVTAGKFKSLCLIGKAGTGKTHLACGAIRALGYGTYKLASEIISEIDRSRAFGSVATETDVIAKYGRTKLLVIDEINRGFRAADEQYMLYQIINARYNNCLPTVLIGNNTKSEFYKFLGNAVTDRLSESATTLEAEGDSYRVTKRLA